jgi:hypothetical protein
LVNISKQSSETPIYMDRYIVISSHTAEDCRLAVKYFREYHAGFLTNFEWGCHDHDHTAYAIIDAESHEQAKMAVPPLFREKTKVVKLVTFNPKSKSDPDHKAE